MTSHRHRAISGAIQLSFGGYILKVFEFLGSIYLARNIAPEIFGKVGYIIAIEMMFWSFMLINPPMAIIRETKDDISYAKTALAIVLVLSSVITVLIFISSYFLPRFDDQLRLLLMVIILTKLFDSVVTSVYAPFLDKQFLYTRKAVIQVVPMIVGISTACLMVLFGYKIEALAARYAVDHIIRFFLVLFLAPHIFAPKITLRHAKKFFHFNIHVGVAGFLRDITNSCEVFIFTNNANMRELGLHNRGFGLSSLVASSLTSGISSVIPAVASKKKVTPVSLHSFMNP